MGLCKLASANTNTEPSDIAWASIGTGGNDRGWCITICLPASHVPEHIKRAKPAPYRILMPCPAPRLVQKGEQHINGYGGPCQCIPACIQETREGLEAVWCDGQMLLHRNVEKGLLSADKLL